jgi:hypothetical protein
VGMINWIFDIYQHTRIEDARQEASAARAEVASMRSSGGSSLDSERVERALGELALATKTLQRMMVEKSVCSNSELQSLLHDVDVEDGRTDGQAPI